MVVRSTRRCSVSSRVRYEPHPPLTTGQVGSAQVGRAAEPADRPASAWITSLLAFRVATSLAVGLRLEASAPARREALQAAAAELRGRGPGQAWVRAPSPRPTPLSASPAGGLRGGRRVTRRDVEALASGVPAVAFPFTRQTAERLAVGLCCSWRLLNRCGVNRDIGVLVRRAAVIASAMASTSLPSSTRCGVPAVGLEPLRDVLRPGHLGPCELDPVVVRRAQRACRAGGGRRVEHRFRRDPLLGVSRPSVHAQWSTTSCRPGQVEQAATSHADRVRPWPSGPVVAWTQASAYSGSPRLRPYCRRRRSSRRRPAGEVEERVDTRRQDERGQRSGQSGRGRGAWR